MKFFLNTSILAYALISSDGLFAQLLSEAAKIDPNEIAIKRYLRQEGGAEAENGLIGDLTQGLFDTLGLNKKTEYNQSKNLSPIPKEEAQGYVKYAAAAYCSEDKLKDWNCKYCDSPKSYNSKGVQFVTRLSEKSIDAEGYVAYDSNQDEIIVSIRGSRSLANWITNAKLILVPFNLPYPYNGAKVHYGFKSMTELLYPQILKAVKELNAKYPDSKVVLTGHSLGGATATLLSALLNKDNIIPFERIKLVTFGSPRVGNTAFANYINSQRGESIRVTHKKDLVPLIPLPLTGYLHVMNEHYIEGEGENAPSRYCSNEHGEDPDCIVYLIQGRNWPAHWQYWGTHLDEYC